MMVPSVGQLRDFVGDCRRKVIIAADGQTRTHQTEDGSVIEVRPAGGVAAALDRVSLAVGATYVTRARTETDELVMDGDGKYEVEERSGSYGLKRVVLAPDEEDSYYNGYANQSLWPLFHIAFEKPEFQQSWYEGYRDVNRKFADAIEAELESRSVVWVNDYQLALVPGMVNRRGDVRVGFYWHIPWPSWDVVRILPQAQDIVRSMLSCDFVGFQTEEDARHFLDAARRALGVHIDEQRLLAEVDGRLVRVGSLPVGIDAGTIRRQAEQSARGGAIGLPENVRRLNERYALLVGADRLDYTKGIKERLLALDRLFERYPRYRGEVCYVGIMAPTREAIPAYQRLREEVTRLGEEINGKYATADWQPLHLLFEGLSRAALAELYTRARAGLVTSLADGMNLVAKEFVVAASCSPDPGVLVLSELAGARNELISALQINPFDTDATTQAIIRALEMNLPDRRRRIDRMARRVERHNVFAWANAFLRETLAPADISVPAWPSVQPAVFAHELAAAEPPGRATEPLPIELTGAG